MGPTSSAWPRVRPVTQGRFETPPASASEALCRDMSAIHPIGELSQISFLAPLPGCCHMPCVPFSPPELQILSVAELAQKGIRPQDIQWHVFVII
jgi:hypothetical protein